MNDSSERAKRAQEFANKLAATGLSKAEFEKQSGLTRNVVYNLSKGQAPSSPEMAAKLAAAFEQLNKK